MLLKAGEQLDATAPLVKPTGGEGFLPGEYRIEATLYGWSYDSFSDAERTELQKMGNPFLRGEVPASIRITLTR